MFDCWADTVVHLLLLKGSMDWVVYESFWWKFLLQKSPNYLVILWANFKNGTVKYKGFFLAISVKIWATFYSNIWSHWVSDFNQHYDDVDVARAVGRADLFKTLIKMEIEVETFFKNNVDFCAKERRPRMVEDEIFNIFLGRLTTFAEPQMDSF